MGASESSIVLDGDVSESFFGDAPCCVAECDSVSESFLGDAPEFETPNILVGHGSLFGPKQQI